MRRRTLPPLDELHAGLAEAGVTDAPTTGDEERLRGLLDLALFVAEHKKKVSFPGFTWDDPRFLAEDAKVTLTFAYAEFEQSLEGTLRLNLGRIQDGETLLALDAHRAHAREFELGHELYGQVTLYQWPHKPPEPADGRIHDAMAAGWARTLKEHNLLPGRGIVVLDEHQGLFLRDSRLRALVGLLILLQDGHTRLWWNPFVVGADAEMQWWLTWGAGTSPASAWREQLFVEEREE